MEDNQVKTMEINIADIHQISSKPELMPSASDLVPKSPCASYLKSLVGNFELSDVTFVLNYANESDSTIQQSSDCRVPGHKVLLAARSPVFKDMLFGAKMADKEIRVTDVRPDVFLAILRYIYTDEIDLDVPCLWNFFWAAEKYDLKDLKCFVGNRLMDDMTERTALKTFESFRRSDRKELIDKMVDFIGEHTLPIIRDESFESIQRYTLRFILNEPTLNTVELHLFEACLRWARAECKRNSIEDPTPEQLREALGDELFLLRIPMMSKHDFFNPQGPFYSRIFDTNELVQLMSFESGQKQNVPSEFVSKFCLEQRKTKSITMAYIPPNEEKPVPEEDELMLEFWNSLSFTCSEDLYLQGFQFISSKKDFFSSDLSLIAQSTDVIFYQKEILIRNLENQRAEFYFPSPILIESGVIYELKFRIRPKPKKNLRYYCFERKYDAHMTYTRPFDHSPIHITYLHTNKFRFNIDYLYVY